MTEEQTPDNLEQTTDNTQAPVERPEYVPEKFWNKDTNEINVEDLSISYNALEKKLGSRTEDLSKQIRDDIEKERLSSAPETYEIKSPELPDNVQLDINPEMPLLQWWQELAKSKGLSQDEFNSGIKAFAENEVNALPNQEEEMKLLGENSKERVESADLWAKKNLSPEGYEAVAELASTAMGVKVIEEVMKLTKDAPMPQTETRIDVEPDKIDLRSMMADPRYWKDGEKDPAYIRKVTDLYEKYEAKKTA